jgi:hypothetical protein
MGWSAFQCIAYGNDKLSAPTLRELYYFKGRKSSFIIDL